jgi:hypothetical protein
MQTVGPMGSADKARWLVGHCQAPLRSHLRPDLRMQVPMYKYTFLLMRCSDISLAYMDDNSIDSFHRYLLFSLF